MSFDNFIPALWAGRILKNLNNDHVYAQCCNKDYEGEIKNLGASVKINAIGRVTINDFTRNSNLAAVEELDDAGQTLLINQGKYYNFALDDVDVAQSKSALMSEAMGEASWGLAEVTDDFIAATMNAAVASANTLTAATVGTGAGEKDAYSTLVEMGVALDDANVPEKDRWAVVPNWFSAMLRLDPRVVSFGTGPNLAVYRGAPVHESAGFMIYKSNNVPSTTDVLAGWKGAVTFAEQILKTEAYSPELRFADAVKGLHVYGAKVLRPTALAKIVATQGAY